LCKSSDHETNLCPYYACYAQPDFASPWDNTDVVLTIHDSSFPLAQCTGFEASELFGFEARFNVTDACFESEDTLEKVHDLDKTSLEGSRDVLVREWSPSLGFDDTVLPNHLDHFYISPICSLPPFSLEYYIDVPIDNHKICDLVLTWAMRIMCLMCLVGMLTILCT